MKKILFPIPALLLILCIFFAVSCRKNKSADATDGSRSAKDSVGQVCKADEDFTGGEYEPDPEDFETVQLNDSTYVLNPRDTIVLEQPFIRLFRGELNGQGIQLWLTYNLPMNEGLSLSYRLDGLLYIDGEENIRKVYFETGKNAYKGYVYKDDDNEEVVFELTYTKNSNTVAVKGGTDRYTLQESELEFTAYDVLDYENVYCTDQGIMRAHWYYHFSFWMKTIPEKYSKVFVEMRGQTDSIPEQKWTHSIAKYARKGSLDDEDSSLCFTMYDMSYKMPVYLDDKILVVAEYSEQYMGGAHGIYTTDYHNYDIKTGKSLNLNEIVDTDNADFWEMHNEKAAGLFEVDSESVDAPSGFFILPTGIIFRYPPYSMTGGFWEKEMFLTFEELAPYLKKAYY